MFYSTGPITQQDDVTDRPWTRLLQADGQGLTVRVALPRASARSDRIRGASCGLQRTATLVARCIAIIAKGVVGDMIVSLR